MGGDDQGKKTQGAHPVDSGEVADAGWDGDEYRVEKGYAYCDSGGDTAGYQQGHDQNGAASPGKGADCAGDDTQKDEENNIVCKGSRSDFS